MKLVRTRQKKKKDCAKADCIFIATQITGTSLSLWQPKKPLWVHQTRGAPSSATQHPALWALPFTTSTKPEQLVLSSLPLKQSCREALALGPQKGRISILRGTGGHTHTPWRWGQQVPPRMCKSETLLRPWNSRGLSCLSLALCPPGLWLLWQPLGNVSLWGGISCWLVPLPSEQTQHTGPSEWTRHS